MISSDRAAALTTVTFNIPATASVTPFLLGSIGSPQYSYGGAAFKQASLFTPNGSALIGSASALPGIDANDSYTASSQAILFEAGATLPANVFYRLKFDADGQSQLGYAAFDTAGTLTSVSYQAAVPEPAAWAMLVVGFGASGAALRRRRRQQRLTQAA